LRNFLVFLMPLLNFNQCMCNFIITLNRFTAIFWNRFTSPTILVGVIVASACACSRLPIYTIWKFHNNAYTIKHLINLNAFWYQIGYCSLLMTICAVLNIISLANLRKMKVSKKTRDIERSFFLISICTFVAEFANLLILTGKQIAQSSSHSDLWYAFNIASPYVTDVCSLGLPYYLLLVK
ncbi:hypothetical protein PFISCL1PPCAC_11775, partial [Pristionchus fissidentatus]